MGELGFNEKWNLRLVEEPDKYKPEFLNPLMMFGSESIRNHLIKEHNLSPINVDKMEVDDCYRLHDQIHEQEERKNLKSG